MAETVSNSFGPRKVCGNSTTNEKHNGRTGPRADLAEWPDHYKLQGPLFSVTKYAVSPDLCRTIFPIMVSSRRWCRLLPSTSTRWACLTLLTVLTEHSTKGSLRSGRTWRPGTTCILTGTSSTRTEGLLMATSTTTNKSSLFSNGRCMTRS